MKNLSKAAIVSLMALTLMLTACSPNDDAGNVPAPTTAATATAEATEKATPTASATPSAEPVLKSEEELEAGYDQQVKDAEKAYAERPLGLDVDHLYAEYLADDVLTVFPEEQFNTKASIHSALSTYRDLATLTNWQKARDTSQDWSLVAPMGGKIDADFLQRIEAATAERGKFSEVLTIPGDGIIEFEGKEYKVIDETLKQDFENFDPKAKTVHYPEVYVSETGDSLVIDGVRTYSYDLEGGQTFKGSENYWIEFVPDADGDVLLKSFGRQGISVDVVSADAKGSDD